MRAWRHLLTTAVICSCFLVTFAIRGDRLQHRTAQYRTAYECEGGHLHISCEEGSLIHLIRANYGRFSISICNEHGVLDWSVDCMSHRSFRVMQQSCDMKKNCSLPASSSMFGDACPGTLKYLEAHYQCVPEATSSSVRQPPPIIIPSPLPTSQSTSSSTTPVTRRLVSSSTSTSTLSSTEVQDIVDVTTASTQHSKSVSSPVTASVSVVIFPSETPLSGKTSHKTENQSLAILPTKEPNIQTTTSTNNLSALCKPTRFRNMLWNWTKAGEVAVQHCPGGATGEAKWTCDLYHVQWVPDHPDLSNCKSLWVTSLEDRFQYGDSVVSIGAELEMMTRAKTMYGGDILPTINILHQLVNQMGEKILEFHNDRQRHQVVKELTQSVIDVGSGLLDDFQIDAWNDLPPSKKWMAASALLMDLEQNALLLADTMNQEGHFLRVHSNLLVAVHVHQMTKVSDMRLPHPNDVSGTPWSRMQDSVFLPVQVLLMNARNGLVKIIFQAYNKLDDLLDPVVSTESEDIEGWKGVQQIINSRIIAVSLGRQHIKRLPEPVYVTLKLIQEENVTNPRCVFWNTNRRDWSEQGCWVHSFNNSHTVCGCNHLTSFAVLMDVRVTELSFEHEVALRVITYVGCVISIACLFLTILTFQCFRSLKSDRTTIHKNLCLCLLIAEVVFVAGIDQTHLRVVCGVVAGMLHYFFLAAFIWMFLEGFQLYVMLIEVFESEKSRIGWYYALAYGIPALIVGIAAAVDPLSYGTTRYCWLRADNYFIFSFVGPVIAILLANTVFLGMAIYMMCRHTTLSNTMKSKEQTKLTSVKVWVRGAMVLVFLLGLTWAFGLLYLNQESVVMAYVFTVLNSFQGLFIFIFHCIRNEKVQKEYHKLISRSPWIPSCIRHHKSADHRSSFYVHSNGTSSAPHSSGQHSSHHQSWDSQKKQNATTSSSSLLKSSTQGPPSTTCHQKPGHDNKHSDSINTSHSKAPGVISDNGGIIGDLSMADCSVIDSECVSDYCCEKSGQITLSNPHEGRHPPYGHLRGSNSPYVDHIYESIDDDPGAKLQVRYPTLCHHHISALEGHVRSHSNTSHQSSSSIVCDHRPLIAPALPQRNSAVTHFLESTSTTPRHSSLPTARDLQRQQNPRLHTIHRLADVGNRASNSLNNLERPGLCATLPLRNSTGCDPNSEEQPQDLWNCYNPQLAPDSTVMMAVLDGERVVCRLQPEGNSPPSRAPHFYGSSHLSTDC